MRYQKIEKVALALVTAARRLRQYLLAYTIVVKTDKTNFRSPRRCRKDDEMVARIIRIRHTLGITEGTKVTGFH